jgi:starch-binding outer membrane protein, SusD/RagB family
MRMNDIGIQRWPRRVSAGMMGLVTLVALGPLTACSFDVTNPGPVQAQFLDDPAARAAIVNGAGRDLSNALNWIAYTGAAASREIFPAGSTGSFGITPQEQAGVLLASEGDDFWDRAQRARWEAESGAVRFKTTMSPQEYAGSAQAGQILLWAGYANRLLGENMCDATIDGGPKVASTVFLTRADSEFTEAMTIAAAAGDTKSATAARAARASVRADLGNWTAAAADAALIADTFVFQMPYFTTDADQYNRIYWATANAPYRAHTVWNTFYDSYYTSSGDARVAWGESAKTPVGDGAVFDLGRVAWHFETKFAKKDAAMNLSSGWEMRLIQAEARLVANDVPGAMTLLNKHRVALGLSPWTATTSDEAWTVLKRERGIELWLEGRRLGDLRRWKSANSPGTLSVYEVPGATSHLDPAQTLCFPISNSELQTNPNLRTP